MTGTTLLSELPRILAALFLVVLAAGVSRWQHLDLEKQMLVAVVRAFIQLTLIGYALNLIFAADNPAAILLILAVMTSIASYTSGKRGEGTPHATRVAALAITFGAALTLGLLVGLRVFTFSAQQIIPIAGMVIGNSMNVCSLVMRRMKDEIKGRQLEIETALALGATRQQAVRPHLKTALQSGMMPIVDSTKTVGLIQLPGAMTGMILAGASPLEAVQLQMIVMYMLIGAAALTGLAAAWLSYRQFFTASHQLVAA
ncbi:MAG: iron export ABC transporter permease subunit FetB [Chloroflexi bacterium]|jgi:putative ABC transport system permease protein|nr:iron export ABC transporter permease subunit FetB [Chloroflexota bacterium]MBK6710844.1 iron export ABC transporter permease subunit FetB [Chloroflexota bacterium]MBK7176529.1 iron export ABC transporter permease subunit FetB [Chloroflexota bacterium]MBK7915510.1 iron export ABC transporter permease subunit FetB [Chloroflexota bacterium]MBK8933974.1 iron export ABC transporter permease subunit FetB [Chloroflexota bacterium]